jgi:tetratricopeptide (TPR) repeat protein
MPAPKQKKPLLTAIEKERLYDRDIDPIIRKRNDMIVRNKLMAWLNNADDAIFALEHLSTRKLKKEIDDNYIYRLLEIVRELLDLKDFGKLYDFGNGVVVIKSIVEHHNPNIHIDPKPHTVSELDFHRIYKLESALEEIASLIPKPDESPSYEKYKEEQFDKSSSFIAKFSINGKQPSKAEYWHRIGCQTLFGHPRMPYPQSRLHIEKSIKYFDKAIELEPNCIEAWRDKAYALGELGAYEEALECVDKVLAADPTDPEVWRVRAIYDLSIGNYEESLKSLDRAIQIDPSNTPAIIMKIDILKSLGRESEAEDLISHHFKKDKKLKELKGWIKSTTKSTNRVKK